MMFCWENPKGWSGETQCSVIKKQKHEAKQQRTLVGTQSGKEGQHVVIRTPV